MHEPRAWRLQSRIAGSGALGDIGAHIVDLAQFLIGEIETVSAVSTTFVRRRRAADAGFASAGDRNRMVRVDVDDSVSVIGTFRNGAVLNLEATRFAPGRKNQLCFEINGSSGSLVFDLERMNRLQFYSTGDAENVCGFRDIIVTEASHPYLKNWWPPGHLIGYEHSFIHTIADFVEAVVRKQRIRPDFADGLQTQRILDAVQRSAEKAHAVRIQTQ